MKLLGLEETKPADMPGSRTTGVGVRDALDPSIGQELELIPQAAGFVNYLAAGRPDIQHALKCVLSGRRA